MRRWSTLWLLGLLAAAACASLATVRSVAKNSLTGLELVVTNAGGDRHGHPAIVNDESVGAALRLSGFFVDDDIAAMTGPIARELARLTPNERLWLKSANADFHLFLQGRDLVIVRFVKGDEQKRVSYTLPPNNATVVLAGPPKPLVQAASPEAP
jgi:hypothetical protein